MPIADKNSATLAKANPRIIAARRCLRESWVRSSIVRMSKRGTSESIFATSARSVLVSAAGSIVVFTANVKRGEGD